MAMKVQVKLVIAIIMVMAMKLKAFCIYHREDIDKRFTEEQKQKLLDHHAKALMIAN
jgi:hypothetical protein